MNKNQTLPSYFLEWMEMYKQGAVRDVTYKKYELTYQVLKRLVPRQRIGAITRSRYQSLLNDYAKDHEKQTVLDFHHLVKGAVLDAVDEGLIERDPTRKVVIKGVATRLHKPKFISQKELQDLLQQLELSEEISWDWLILLIAKTGLRFSEALGLTPDDFDFANQTLAINKTWNYKASSGGFSATKNESSVRKIRIDWQLAMQFNQLLRGKDRNKPIFVNRKKIYNATVNSRLEKLCKKAGIPTISIHGLRHTHASLLLYAGVSIASVAKRLGHSNMTTTQTTYLHIVRELENKDTDKVIQVLGSL